MSPLSKSRVFWGVIALQVLILLSLPGQQYAARLWGHTVELRVAPYDPYSVLSGYYAQIGYAISTPMGLENFDALPEGTEVFTVIVPAKDGACDAVRMSLEKPEIFANERIIRGTKEGARVAYKNLEQYFIPETSREAVDAGLRDPSKDPRAIVRIDKNGNPALHGLRIGNAYY